MRREYASRRGSAHDRDCCGDYVLDIEPWSNPRVETPV
jgi:hypothetical protein